jgi:hypothetical protein
MAWPPSSRLVHILLLPLRPARQKLLRLRAKKSLPPRGNLTMDSLFFDRSDRGRWKRLTDAILSIRAALSKLAATLRSRPTQRRMIQCAERRSSILLSIFCCHPVSTATRGERSRRSRTDFYPLARCRNAPWALNTTFAPNPSIGCCGSLFGTKRRCRSGIVNTNWRDF